MRAGRAQSVQRLQLQVEAVRHQGLRDALRRHALDTAPPATQVTKPLLKRQRARRSLQRADPASVCRARAQRSLNA